MDLSIDQLYWLVGMAAVGGLLSWIHRRRRKTKSLGYALQALITAEFIAIISYEAAHHWIEAKSLCIMIGGAMGYYSDFAIELGKKILERKSSSM